MNTSTPKRRAETLPQKRYLALNRTALTALTLLVLATAANARTDISVAQDGSGQYKTVQEAINATPQTANAANPVFINIKPGIYKELIYVQREKRWVHLVGEDAAKTVLTYNLNANQLNSDGKIIGTFRTPSTYIDADEFTAENLTFENSAGPVGQALAIRVDGDRVVFPGETRLPCLDRRGSCPHLRGQRSKVEGLKWKSPGP